MPFEEEEIIVVDDAPAPICDYWLSLDSRPRISLAQLVEYTSCEFYPGAGISVLQICLEVLEHASETSMTQTEFRMHCKVYQRTYNNGVNLYPPSPYYVEHYFGVEKAFDFQIHSCTGLLIDGSICGYVFPLSKSKDYKEDERCPDCQNRRFIQRSGKLKAKQVLGYSPGIEACLQSITNEPDYWDHVIPVAERGLLYPDQWSGALFKRVNELLGGRLWSDSYMAIGLGYDPFVSKHRTTGI